MRIATVRWMTPPPTSVDETLAVYADGSARLVVVGPREAGAAIGTYAGTVDPDDRTALEALGSLSVDLLAAPPAGRSSATLLVAERVAGALRAAPLATAGFAARPLGSAAGRIRIGLVVVGGGSRAVELELSPESCAILFAGEAAPLGWLDLPRLETGFVTPRAVGLGGLRDRAIIEPGVIGAISVEVALPPEATTVAFRVAGRLYEALPDEPEGRGFEVLTEAVPLEP